MYLLYLRYRKYKSCTSITAGTLQNTRESTRIQKTVLSASSLNNGIKKMIVMLNVSVVKKCTDVIG